jgi:peptide deformylase
MAFTGPINRQLTRVIESVLRQAPQGHIPLTCAGDPVLREGWHEYTGQIGRPVFRKLIADMRTTMLDAPGVGLAAPQVGIPLAFAVVEDHVEPEDRDSADPRDFAEFPFHAIINPHYEPIGTKTASFYEGCLSVPGFQAVRRRWHDIRATWQDPSGARHTAQLHGWPARIFQHETDHLSGELYIDKCEIRSLSSDDNLGELWWDPTTLPDEARQMGFSLK